MKLIVGLGNPGPEYKDTRHNVGFMVVEKMADFLRVKRQQHVHESVIAEARYKSETILLVKPLTYMNLSGVAVKKIIRSKKLTLSDIMVIYDDMDLELGRMRMRANGGSGGHKGMQSIIEEIGSSDFSRLRIGIGRPEQGHVIHHVLNRFDPEEAAVLNESAERAVQALNTWIVQGIVRAMNQFNQA